MSSIPAPEATEAELKRSRGREESMAEEIAKTQEFFHSGEFSPSMDVPHNAGDEIPFE